MLGQITVKGNSLRSDREPERHADHGSDQFRATGDQLQVEGAYGLHRVTVVEREGEGADL